MSRRPVLLLIAALALAGCRQEPPDVGGNTDRQLGPGDRYVALGDSYTAYPTTGDPDDDAGCQRSPGNYPSRLAAALDLELADVSCGGAETRDLRRSQRTLSGERVAPQLDAVTGSTDLVTLALGGADFDLVPVLLSSCVQGYRTDPEGSPCADRLEGKLDGRIRKLTHRLIGAIDDIHERAPEARIVVVSYPRIFPEETGCPPTLQLASGDVPFAARVVEEVVGAQRTAAEATNAEFVDVHAATEGHDICGDEPWVAGFEVQRPGEATFYHPYPEHQRLVARLLEELLSPRG